MNGRALGKGRLPEAQGSLGAFEEAVLAAVEAGSVSVRVTCRFTDDLHEGRRPTEEECLVASVRAVGPGNGGDAASLLVGIEVMPVAEAIELRSPVARPVILETDGADEAALESESVRAAGLLQDRFLERAFQVFGVPSEVVGVEVAGPRAEAPR